MIEIICRLIGQFLQTYSSFRMERRRLFHKLSTELLIYFRSPSLYPSLSSLYIRIGLIGTSKYFHKIVIERIRKLNKRLTLLSEFL